MNNKQTKAILLKRLDFGEADRIITVITPDYGKVSLLAKGVRKTKSKLAGGLELFSVTEIGFIEGRSQLKTVVSTRLVEYYKHIVEDLSTTMIAYDFLKYIDIFTEDKCGPEYFNLLEEALRSVADNPALTELWFMSQLLHIAGHGINLDHEVDGADFDENLTYEFSYDDMGFIKKTGGFFTPKHIKFLRLMNKVSAPAHMLKVQNAVGLERDLKPLMSRCIQITRQHSY